MCKLLLDLLFSLVQKCDDSLIEGLIGPPLSDTRYIKWIINRITMLHYDEVFFKIQISPFSSSNTHLVKNIPV